jgi:DNA processing protein
MSLETKGEEDAGRGEIGPAGRALLAQLHHDQPVHVDQLIETFDTLTPSEIIAGLFELELLGMVRQLPGKNFVKVW